jgi:hypothetical protein
MSHSRLRVWLSPLTTVTFLAIGMTGVLMFFHVRAGAINVLHEIAGLLFVVVGLTHLVVNWKTLVGYLRQRAAQVALAVGLLLCVALLALGAGHEEHHGRPAGAPAAQAEETR